MDRETIKQNISDFYSRLPKEAQEYFSSMVWLKKIEEISEKYNLAIDEIEGVATETMMLLLGMTDLRDFEKELIVNLRQDDDVAEDKIIKEIYDSVINPVGEDKIKEFFNPVEYTEEKTIETFRNKDQVNTAEGLPSKVQNAISLSDWQESLIKITKENNLNIEQSGVLEDITVKTMQNKIHFDAFLNEVLTKVTDDNEKAQKITTEVNDKIFQKIRDIMKSGESVKVSNPEEDIVPLPPYPIKTVVAEPIAQINTTSYKTAESNESKRLQDILNSQIKEIGSEDIKNINFEVPKTAQNIVKDAPSSNISMSTSKPHDPYREVL